MNETRKQIIKLIQPEMNKELSDGCLILRGDFSEIVKYGEYKIKSNEVYNVYCLDDTDYLNEIIGHYDITAQIKFIFKTKLVSEGLYDIYITSNGDIVLYNTSYNANIGKDFIIKNPNLYTEEQEKRLLKILLKLNKGKIK